MSAAASGRGSWLFVAILFLALCGIPRRACASSLVVANTGLFQDARQGDPAEQVAEIEKRLTEVEGITGVDAAAKKTLTEVLTVALQQAKSAQAEFARAHEFEAAAKSAPLRLVEAKQRLSALPAEVTAPTIPDKLDLESASRGLAKAEAELSDVKRRETSNNSERQRRTTRLSELPKRIQEARDAVLKERSATPETRDEPDVLVPARKLQARSKLAALEATLASLEAEKLAYEAESDLLVVEAQLIERETLRANKAVEAWQARVQKERQVEADRAAKQAKEEAARAAVRENAVLREFAAENAKLAETAKQLADHVTRTTEELDASKKLRTNLAERFQEIKNRIDIAGLTDAIGLQLRQEKSRLPNIRTYAARVEDRQSTLRNEQLEQIDTEERIATLQTVAANELSRSLDASVESPSAATLEVLHAEADQLVRSRADFLENVRKNRERYISQLVELDTEEQILVQKSREYASFVNERVLWIRSAAPIWETRGEALSDSIRFFLDWNSWKTCLDALGRALQRSPVRFVLGALVALLLILFERPMFSRIREFGVAASKGSCTRFMPTAWTFVLTVLAAGGWPFAFWHVANSVLVDGGGADFTVAIAAGVVHAAAVWYGLALLRVTLRPGGLGEAHYRWQPSRSRLVRRNLVWFVPLMVPLSTMLWALSTYNHAPWAFALDRIVLMVQLALIAAFAWFTLNVKKGALAAPTKSKPSGWELHRYLWFGLAMLAPVAFFFAAAAGYHLTALELELRLISSLGVLLVSVLLYGLAVRWMLLVKRKIAMEQARARYEAAKQAREAERAAALAAGKGEASSEPAREVGPVAVDEEINLAAVDAQTKTLLRGALAAVVLFVLWAIWVDVLPALGVLDEVELWQTNVETTSELGVIDTKIVPITLGSVLLSVLVLLITFASARNIPGLLELSVLRRLKVEAGERYAITTLVRYAIVTIGVVAAFSSIGIGWGKVQWLVAAVSVGLGFGLQEIFANFVSGLIILFERPVRIGDFVTVAGVDGYVSRIRMRATTIVDFDRREMIVPNKEFVTNSLVNWTLTDPITRVVLKVGVAYGSNTERVRELLLAVAKKNKIVLDDPAPQAIFFGFGDSSLDFQLRVFISTRDLYPQLVDEINTMIDNAFREHDIEIPFPQRDLHVRSVVPLRDALPQRSPTEQRPPSEQ
ncbi:MAG: mechanosensitive ion channel [Planctomycetes bacterium]|nr:mechanosensitive ion channel [Planctomycetota bacterium]